MIKSLVALILVAAFSASALAASEKAQTRPQQRHPQSTSEHPGRQMREHKPDDDFIGDVTTIPVGNVNTGSRATPPFANTAGGAAPAAVDAAVHLMDALSNAYPTSTKM